MKSFWQPSSEKSNKSNVYHHSHRNHYLFILMYISSFAFCFSVSIQRKKEKQLKPKTKNYSSTHGWKFIDPENASCGWFFFFTQFQEKGTKTKKIYKKLNFFIQMLLVFIKSFFFFAFCREYFTWVVNWK